MDRKYRKEMLKASKDPQFILDCEEVERDFAHIDMAAERLLDEKSQALVENTPVFCSGKNCKLQPGKR